MRRIGAFAGIGCQRPRQRCGRLVVLLRVEVRHAERVLHLGKFGIHRRRLGEAARAAREKRCACACMTPRFMQARAIVALS